MYIDFKMLKRKLDVKTVIDYFSISNLSLRNDAYSGSCPIHNGDNNTAFHFNIKKKIWHCWTKCGGGNILDFIAKFKKLNIYQAALVALDILGDSFNNDALNFKLNLEHRHNYFVDRNISFNTTKFFDIGFCNFGFLKNRIAIPVHDTVGNLVAYAGRTLDNSEPKYLFPKKFEKSKFLYNFHRIALNFKNNYSVFIVEGFFDVLRLHQFGLNAVALMGTALSNAQLNLLKMLNANYILMLDGDYAGKQATANIADVLNSNNLKFYVINLKSGYDPDSIDPSFITSLNM